jgi:type IV pilus assembly protein PilQ
VNVDIQLDVTPRVNSSDEISLQLDTQVSAIINFVGPDKDRPVVSTRSAKTNVVVGNGETLLIGGLILEDNTDNLGKVPFLSNIPIIKTFFTMKTKGRQQRELLIFITPAIIG